ncbi:hypothetical protein [Ornithinimicrobium pratense]|uniref:Uncharacterized protein n=1 Tax=Ornithinimicrobium pratense TaxID=2593973 RepID=A0A5J6V840_9MICO|nr:hypothetical protein [Ornithinimicrobium pratense]QFG69172.1 hypothetical protein FY030_11065 [Ornithinimicrobium pratense]
MENAIVTGIGTGVQGSTLPTLRAFRLRASGFVPGSVGGSVRLFDHTVPAPQPIFDPTHDVTPVRIT